MRAFLCALAHRATAGGEHKERSFIREEIAVHLVSHGQADVHVCITGEIPFTQGGYAGSTSRPVTLIAIRPGYGKFAVGTGTITQSKAIALSVTAEQDRVYA